MSSGAMSLEDLVAELANREGGRLVLLTMQHHDTTCGGEWRTCRAELCGWVRAIAVPIVAAEVLPTLREAASLWAAVKETAE